uniref:Uncharacterized protein n=1 Tax=Anguilla anguilla TaxID=7936 RepID=A0A0E9PPJ6_ANGAN
MWRGHTNKYQTRGVSFLEPF